VRRPVWSHVCADVSALGANHSSPERSDGCLVRESIAVDLAAVAAMDGATIHQEITAAEPPDVGQGDTLERLARSWGHEPDDRPAASPASMASDAGSPPGGVRGKARKFRFCARCCQSDWQQQAGLSERMPHETERVARPVPWPERPKGSRWAGHPRVGPSRSDCPIRSAAVRVVLSESLNAELTASPF
jgi:hypothetical protein